MGSYDQPPGMGGYHYGPPHAHQQHPGALSHSHHQHPPPPHPHAYQHHQQPPYQQHPPPPTHQQPPLPPMPQYQGQMPHQIPSQMPPPDRPGNGMPPQAQMITETPRSIEPVSRQDAAGRLYKLDVVQQPQRARMCGFGDKDRRPITPPPCVRIVLTDPNTGKEIDVNEIDHVMFVLNVDLWSEDGQREVNLVRHTNSAPSISSTTPCSYTGIADNAYHPILPSNTAHRETQYAPTGGITYPPHQSQPTYAPAYGAPAPGYPVQQQQYGPPGGYPPSPAYPGYNGLAPADYPRQNYVAGGFSSRGASGGSQSHQGMYTRNLIGSLAASAFRLTDTSDRIGIWFILQDLSIRTEGTFRLRFSFVNVGPTGPPMSGGKAGKAPILASCYSMPFTVYSAKKFPGVCDSTPLSKCFASQGIKIPIRKEGQDSKRKDDDDDDY